MSEQEKRQGAIYAFVTIGARTERGGYYPNGTTARIVSGLAIKRNRALAQFAYVESGLDNGDTITDSPDCKRPTWSGTWEVVTEAQMQDPSEAV
ncbi:MAG: hypothetical protein LBV73_01965 [Paraburkholderia sp.]|jgi:hypothetical protein|nr:hypothetical protein [Paraburkholderia sp.]